MHKPIVHMLVSRECMYRMKRTESPAMSRLVLTNTLQPVVNRCLLGCPVNKLSYEGCNASKEDHQFIDLHQHLRIQICNGQSLKRKKGTPL